MMWLLVGVGGALGSMARYGITQAVGLWLPAGFPFGTFLVNALGCTVFGVLAGVGERTGVMTPALRAFCLTGVLGGLTTFSSFSYDNVVLVRDGAWSLAVVNALGQLVVGFAAVAGGWWAARALV
jgi:CrcB protein